MPYGIEDKKMKKAWKDDNMLLKEYVSNDRKALENTHYEFTKDGKTYASKGNNLTDARWDAETRFGIDLTGATYKEIYGLKKVVRQGTLK